MLRHRCKRLISLCHTKYIASVEESLRSNPREFWRYINSKKGRSSIPNTVSFRGQFSSGGREVCELFSKCFAMAFEPAASGSGLWPSAGDSRGVALGNVVVSESEILGTLKKLDKYKGAGPDGIPPYFLTACADELCVPLCLIFNKSLRSGCFPTRWKTAHVIPIHKSDDKTVCENYRPISILSSVAKLFESIIYEHIYNHVKGVLSVNQHGFIRGRSTVSNLLEYKTYLCDAFSIGGQVDAIYTDFSKAFDKVDHVLLCQRMASHGIHGNLLRWICSYLSNRSQLVAVGGFVSVPVAVTSGVPQGSHLGPLMFIIFINNLVSKLSCSALLYADDLKLFHRITGIESCIALQLDLDTLTSWCKVNRMSLNVKKCCVISFTKRFNKTIYNYSLDSVDLRRESIVKDLGVVFDDQLSFRSHYSHILSRGSQLLGFILRSTKEFKNPDSITNLYVGLVRSVLEYACPIWSPYYQIHIDSIEGVQKRFLRVLARRCGLGRTLSAYEQRLSFFKLMSLEYRRKRYDIIYLHKIIHNRVDSSVLLGSLNFNIIYRTRNPRIFSILAYSDNTSHYNPIARMCRLYDDLHSRRGDSIDIFDSRLLYLKKCISLIL